MAANDEILKRWIADQEFVFPARAFFKDAFPIEDGQLFPSNQKSFNMIKALGCSIARCKEVIVKLETTFGGKVVKLDMYMDEYDYSGITADDVDLIMSNDMGVPRKVQKSATYTVATNCLLIYQDGYPVYENNNGVICQDEVALADTYC